MAVNFPSIAWIPVGIIVVMGLGFWATEMAFFVDLGMTSKTATSIYPLDNECFTVFYNNTSKDIEDIEYQKCKSDYGFFGWKQWTNDNEEDLIERSLLKVINPSPQKVIVVPEGSNFIYNLDE